MRTVALIAAAAAAFTLSACNKPAEEAPAASTEAAEASGAAADTAAMSTEGAMAPATATPNDSAMAPAPQPTPGGSESPGAEGKMSPPAQ